MDYGVTVCVNVYIFPFCFFLTILLIFLFTIYIDELLPPIDRWEYFNHKLKEISMKFAKSKQK